MIQTNLTGLVFFVVVVNCVVLSILAYLGRNVIKMRELWKLICISFYS